MCQLEVRIQSLFVYVILISLSPFHYCFSQYVDVAKEIGIDQNYGQSSLGGGVSFFDFNHDGWDDLTFATASHQVKFYLNLKDGNFDEVFLLSTEQAFESKQVLWIDYNNDGNTDLYVTNFNSYNRLFKNNGSLQFQDVTEDVGLPLEALTSLGDSWDDFDRDGFLDLYLTDKKYDGKPENSRNRLYKNINGEYFIEVTAEAGVSDDGKHPFCATFFDYNKDGWSDIYIAQDLNPRSTLLRNNGNSTFTNVAVRSEADLPLVSGMGIAVGDIDLNGFEDLYVTNTQNGAKMLLYDSSGIYEEKAKSLGVEFKGFSWGANFLDFDNDSDLDLYVSGSLVGSEVPSSTLYEYNLNGFIEVNTGFVGDTVASYSNATGDFNNDGLLDIAVNNINDFPMQVWENRLSPEVENNWTKIDLVGTFSNKDAYGALCNFYVNGVNFIRRKICAIGFLGQNSQYIHIGTGEYTAPDSLIVEWPSGHIDTVRNLQAKSINRIVEGEYSEIVATIRYEGNRFLCPDQSVTLGSNMYGSQFQYNWSTGETTPQIDVITDGWIYLTINHDNASLIDSLLIELETASNPIYNATVEDIVCNGDKNGRITITGNDLSFIEWGIELSEAIIDNLGAGSYHFILGNKYGCEIDSIIRLDNPPPLEIETDYFKNDNEIFEAKAIVSGGIEPFSFNWNDQNNQSSSTANFTQEGLYQLVVTDSRGCESSVVVRISELIASDSFNEQQAIKVYPNPVQNGEILRINLGSNKYKYWELTNAAGALISSGSIGSANFEISSKHFGSNTLNFLKIVSYSGDVKIFKLITE